MSLQSSSPPAGSRRWFLRIGLAVGGAAALTGGAVFVRRGLADGHLTASGRGTVRAIAGAVLDSVLPVDGAAREAALDTQMRTLDDLFANLPPMLRQEISALLGLLGTTVGRFAMTGMGTGWPTASVVQAQAALEKLRLSPFATVQIAYHALRDLVCVSYFTTPDGWTAAGYPGPIDI